jgi:hypothetical protein
VGQGYLSDNGYLQIATTTTEGAAGVSAITSDAIDMAGYDALLVIIPIGTIVTNGVQSVKLQQSDDDAASDAYSDIVGSNQTIADDDDDKLKYIDLQRPQKRYIKVVITRATQNSTYGGIIAFKYQKRFRTTASHGTGVAGEQFNFPAEGTA